MRAIVCDQCGAFFPTVDAPVVEITMENCMRFSLSRKLHVCFVCCPGALSIFFAKLSESLRQIGMPPTED